ncbi:MAG: histidine--tRNA ligase [Oscillospiraceae bacterium]|nr:histidine--tRNA ligase [Oscillospiraceae bacterium]
MKTSPVKGTNDYLPAEAALREYMQNSILATYTGNGFERILTPALEDMENLDKSEGGDNLNLLFRILKRGDKLESALKEQKYGELSDIGLRYDLTVPLSRYFANNRQKLFMPFKCIQIDKAYRAERPQKGREREFIQCDIDILGSNSTNCEIELIHVTAKALLELGLKNFLVRVNDRRLLNALLLGMGFEKNDIASVSITFDKLDKIGVDGVKEELAGKNFNAESIDKLTSLLNDMPITLKSVKNILGEEESLASLEKIIAEVQRLSGGSYEIAFDISLVRGQGYYTGTVFEIESRDFERSIAGGGRYDNLIGKFTNEDIPAVGFSIGFEPIFCILKESGFEIPNKKKKIAVLYGGDIFEADKIAEKFRGEYDVALHELPKKVGKYIDALEKAGYYGIFMCGKSESLEIFSN